MTHLPDLSADFLDILQVLTEAKADFLLVGAHAMAVHGVSRATGDIDMLVRPTAKNAQRVYDALMRFGAPIEAHGVTPDDFSTAGLVYQIGLPPNRIDILTSLTGVAFGEIWDSKTVVEINKLPISVIGLDMLIANKRATGRPKDLADADMLESLRLNDVARKNPD